MPFDCSVCHVASNRNDQCAFRAGRLGNKKRPLSSQHEEDEEEEEEEEVLTVSYSAPKQGCRSGCNCSSPGTAGPLKWESKLGEAFTNEVDYTENGGLLIKHEGFYYIYSKVFYGEIACKQKHTYFSHAICKKMPWYKKEIELMQMKKFYCIDSAGQWLANSYLGGVFHLQPDEEIYVKVDNKELVRLGTAENFFGVFQV
ncbi:TNF14 factor, partial [Polypterus senegalus]